MDCLAVHREDLNQGAIQILVGPPAVMTLHDLNLTSRYALTDLDSVET